MPPKKQVQASSSKTAVDKTFGMKNKNKSAKVQKQVAIIQDQANRAGKSKEALAKDKEKELRLKEKADEEKRKKDEIAMLKPTVTQTKVPFGVDPKTLLCAFFKAGTCEKGSKCKFSHDLDVGRKQEKRDLYADARDEKLEDTMDKWDEEKLRSVVTSKAGNPRTTTDIVCKHFIQAIESQKFGWFWECPSGEACMYRHALPPGFVLKSQQKAAEDAEKAKVISLEEFLEVERHKLGTSLTPVTPESFAIWKQTRMDKKTAEAEAMKNAKSTQAAAGKSSGMSGRDLFQYNPEWFHESDEEDDGDDDHAFDVNAYLKERQAEEEKAEQERIQGFNAGFSTEVETSNEAAGEGEVSVDPPPRTESENGSAGGT